VPSESVGDMFDVHWIIKNERVCLPRNTLPSLPLVNDELRISDGKFVRVKKIVWCLDEKSTYGPNWQRVNIEVEKIKL